jgi:hypothetical protein
MTKPTYLTELDVLAHSELTVMEFGNAYFISQPAPNG